MKEIKADASDHQKVDLEQAVARSRAGASVQRGSDVFRERAVPILRLRSRARHRQCAESVPSARAGASMIQIGARAGFYRAPLSQRVEHRHRGSIQRGPYFDVARLLGLVVEQHADRMWSRLILGIDE